MALNLPSEVVNPFIAFIVAVLSYFLGHRVGSGRE